LAEAKHGDDLESPLFRPVRGNREGQDERRHLSPVMIDRVLRKYAKQIQLARGHADPSTTKLYDRRGYNPEKSASFFANY
jgi:hypothetical protein